MESGNVNPIGVALEDIMRKDASVGIRDISLVLATYRLLLENEKLTLKQAAAKLRTKQDTLYRAVRNFESSVGKSVFAKGPGRSASRVNHGTKDIFDKAEKLIAAYAGLLQPVPPNRILIGSGYLPSIRIVPSVLRTFRERNDANAAWRSIDVTHDLPQRLVGRAEAGELDILLSTVPKSFNSEKLEIVAQLEIPMQIACPRDHSLGRERKFTWEKLDGMTVVLMEANRDPMPQYPFGEIPASATIVRAATYHQAHALVMGGGNTVCFTFPHFFGRNENANMDVVRIHGLEPLRFALLKPKKTRDDLESKCREEIESLIEMFREQIHLLDEEIKNNGRQTIDSHRHVFHMSHLGNSSRQPVWIHGTADLRFVQGGFLKGHHEFYEPNRSGTLLTGKTCHFSVFGRMKEDKGRCQIEWRGDRGEDDPKAEEYQADFIIDKLQLEDGVWVGLWLGRQSFGDGEILTPSRGYMIVLGDELYKEQIESRDEDRVIYRLNEYVKSAQELYQNEPIPTRLLRKRNRK